MDVVIDTSAVIAVIVWAPERPTIIRHTAGAGLAAPASLHWEVGNAFSAMFRRRRITLDQARQAVESYQQMLLRFVDIDLGQSLELAERLGLYAYDAYVVACALNLRAPLLTLDKTTRRGGVSDRREDSGGEQRMKVYTYSEARQNLASLLEAAQRDGAVSIRRKDGRAYVVQPEPAARSPLDVAGIDLDLTTDEVVNLVREGRERYG